MGGRGDGWRIEIEGYPIRRRICHGKNGPNQWHLGNGGVEYKDLLWGEESLGTGHRIRRDQMRGQTGHNWSQMRRSRGEAEL